MAAKATTAMTPRTGFGELFGPDPFFREMENRMRRVFGEGLGRLIEPAAEENWTLTAWSPACDIYETENEIIVKADLPDMKKDDIKVTLENNVLMIKGEKKFEEETKKENYHRFERRYGEFLRTFTLPNFADANHINAEYKDGTLKVMIGKKEEAKPKQVAVNVK